MRRGDHVVIDQHGLNDLIAALAADGRQVVGPVVRDGAVVHGPVSSVADLPRGWRDEQAAGSYRLRQAGDDALFEWAVGPQSAKSWVFPPHEVVWRMSPDHATVTPAVPEPQPVALIGLRPCEVAALATLDRVLDAGAVRDPDYHARRERLMIVAAECGSPAVGCFCTSMGTGPAAPEDVDLALTELDGPDGRRYLVRAGSDAGARALQEVERRPAHAGDVEARRRTLEGAAAAIDRRLDTHDLPGLLARNLEHPRWAEVAERCLACGNCTLVCPTCFCSDVVDTTDLAGGVTRARTWSSCFDLDHSYLHGGPVRSSTSSRYRQWLTHKLDTWWDQFGQSGCVGCGRCIVWCPVGIDLTEEVAAIRSADGAGTPTGP